jgi:ketosteroid isomerase-like protein
MKVWNVVFVFGNVSTKERIHEGSPMSKADATALYEKINSKGWKCKVVNAGGNRTILSNY